jgi:hypothetical protein
MICDLLNNSAPNTHFRAVLDVEKTEYTLLVPIIIAFKGMAIHDNKGLAFKCHTWLYGCIAKISEMRGWLVDDIYRGNESVKVSAECTDEGIAFTIFLEEFQFSKLTVEVS